MDVQAGGSRSRTTWPRGGSAGSGGSLASRVRAADFSTLSGLDVDPVYGPPAGSVVPGLRADRLAG